MTPETPEKGGVIIKKEYLYRIPDKVPDFALSASGAVLIEGPKWCGKTRTAEEKAASVLYMQAPRPYRLIHEGRRHHAVAAPNGGCPAA